MPRPPRKLSQAILNTLDRRPKLRYTLTHKGAKLHTRGELEGDLEEVVDSLTEAIEANNGQPVSYKTWKEFHKPKKLNNTELRKLTSDQVISLISRSKGAFTVA